MLLSSIFTPFIVLIQKIALTEGIRWINNPSNISRCVGETANLTWEYVKDTSEDIRQFRWHYNTDTLIAYRSLKNGLHIDDKYKGRIEGVGDTGILLKNISSKDMGSYSLYPVIAWKERHVRQTIWLNVIDAVDEVKTLQSCTCERLPVFTDWKLGQTINIQIDGCILEINSSLCCVKQPANKCTAYDPQKFCVQTNGLVNKSHNMNTTYVFGNEKQYQAETKNKDLQSVEEGHTTLTFASSYLPLVAIISNSLCFLLFVFWIVYTIHPKHCRDNNVERKHAVQFKDSEAASLLKGPQCDEECPKQWISKDSQCQVDSECHKYMSKYQGDLITELQLSRTEIKTLRMLLQNLENKSQFPEFKRLEPSSHEMSMQTFETTSTMQEGTFQLLQILEYNKQSYSYQ